jgi:hypothetical protein
VVHCLRVVYVTNPVKSRANPSISQDLAGHSSIVLTMELYVKRDAKEAAEVLKKLPADSHGLQAGVSKPEAVNGEAGALIVVLPRGALRGRTANRTRNVFCW